MPLRRRRKRKSDDETSYWLSYSDMMAALLLVFVLIISFTMLQSKRQYEEKEKKLQEQQSQLDDQQDKLDSLMEESLKKESEIEKKDKLIAEQQEKLDVFENWESERDSLIQEKKELETELAEKESEIESQQILIDNLSEKDVASQQIIEELTAEVEAQATQMAEKEATVEAQQEKLDKLIGIRSELVEELKTEFEHSGLNVIVDEQTGAITFDSGILFDFGQYELKASGKDFLDEFLPRYISILQGVEYEPYIAEIIVEGHTDSVGSYLSNLSLSQNRALAVAKYCLADDGVILEKDSIDRFRKIVTANGRSYSNLIYNDDGTENADASRRVEFKFRLKDEEMIQEMRSILEN